MSPIRIALLLGGFVCLAVGASPAARAGVAPDSDGDGIPDALDKCMLDSRNAALSCDTDCDGYGNVCDGDFNQSGTITAADYSMFFVPALSKGSPDSRGSDMNCSGAITAADYSMFFVPQLSKGVPGASGVACAGQAGCACP